MCECETKGRPVIGMRRKRDRQNGSAAGGNGEEQETREWGASTAGGCEMPTNTTAATGSTTTSATSKRENGQRPGDQASTPPHQPVIASFPTTPGHGPPLGSLRFTTYGHKRVFVSEHILHRLEPTVLADITSCCSHLSASTPCLPL